MGLVTAWKFSRRRYVFLLLATLSQVAFASAYKVQDVEVFFLPAFMLTGRVGCLGPDAAVRRVGAARDARGSPAASASLDSLADRRRLGRIPGRGDAVRAGAEHGERLPRAESADSWGVYDYGADMISAVAPGGQVIGLLGETTLVRYFRDVLGQRPDIEVVPADAEAARFAAVELSRSPRGGRPTSRVICQAPPAATAWDAAGPLIAVSPKATAAPSPEGQPLGADVVLAEARTEVRQTHAGPVVRLALTWAAAQPISDELKISARLVDAAGNVIAADDRVPVHFTYPTTAWVPGEPVKDVYDLPLPPGTPGGDFTPLLILYRAADRSEIGRVQLPLVTVPRSKHIEYTMLHYVPSASRRAA